MPCQLLHEVPVPPTKCSAVAHALLTGVSATPVGEGVGRR